MTLRRNEEAPAPRRRAVRRFLRRSPGLLKAPRRANQYAAIARLGELALGGTTTGALLDHAVELLRRAFGADMAEVLEARDGDTFVQRACAGWRDGAPGDARLDARDMLCARLVLEAEGPVIREDLSAEDPDVTPERMRAAGAMSSACVVIRGRDRPYGLLALHSRRRRRFSAEDGDVLAAGANVLAMAIGRAQTEAQLRESEQHARRMNELVELATGALPISLAYFSPDETYRWTNGRDEARHGLPRDALVGRTLKDVHGEPFYGRFLKPRIERVLQGEALHYERSAVAADGTRRDIEVHLAPAYGRNGAVDGFASLILDITDRKRAERQLRESRERFRDLTEMSSDWYWEQDAEGRFTFTSESLRSATGFDVSVVIGRMRRELPVHPDDLPIILQNERVVAERRPFRDLQYRVVGEGVVRHVCISGRPFFDRTGAFAGYRGIGHDVTEQRLAEQALRLSEERYRSVVASLAEGVTIVDHRGVITECNAGAQRILGRDADALVGTSIVGPAWGALHEDGRPMTLAECPAHTTLVHGNACTDTVMGVLRPDGTRVWVSVNTQPVTRPGECRPFALVASFHDITARREAQASLVALNDDLERRVEQRTAELARAHAEAESLSYSIAHDLRAPLRAINGYAEILLTEIAERLLPEVRHYLGRISANAVRMDMLISALLSFGHITRQPLQHSLVSLNDAVADALGWLAGEQAGRPVEMHVADLGKVRADPALVRIALSNLLSNALKFTRGRSPARIEVATRQDGGERVFYVRDNGVGFDMRYASKLFGVFQRLHGVKEFEGSGVGLASVQRIVERHGGRIWAESLPDEGATFYFTLGT